MSFRAEGMNVKSNGIKVISFMSVVNGLAVWSIEEHPGDVRNSWRLEGRSRSARDRERELKRHARPELYADVCGCDVSVAHCSTKLVADVSCPQWSDYSRSLGALTQSAALPSRPARRLATCGHSRPRALAAFSCAFLCGHRHGWNTERPNL